VVEPTPLKNMLLKLDHESPIFGVKIPKIFELTPQKKYSTSLGQLLGIHSIAVMHDDIHIKAKIRIRDMLAPIPRRYLEDHPRTCKWLVTPIFKP